MVTQINPSTSSSLDAEAEVALAEGQMSDTTKRCSIGQGANNCVEGCVIGAENPDGDSPYTPDAVHK